MLAGIRFSGVRLPKFPALPFLSMLSFAPFFSVMLDLAKMSRPLQLVVGVRDAEAPSKVRESHTTTAAPVVPSGATVQAPVMMMLLPETEKVPVMLLE